MRLRSLAFATAVIGLAMGVHDARANTWPPVKGADMSNPDNWPNDPGYTSDWNYWSWLPKQLPGTNAYVDADTKLGAAGMRIDTAWTYTTGRPDVKITICDCGIEWEDADLVNKAYLNAGELSGTKAPTNAAGVTCPTLTPASLGYDCDGDGVFTVADYRDDPRMSPMVALSTCTGGMTVQGDAKGNQNCILDAGDLIQLLSDNVDDDKNGYVDDISGWDFYKNDNNPYDDTRYDHGTGEAQWSTDEGNNSIGNIGMCPGCRFQMGRSGDSFIADATDFAKCVVYAADNGSQIVQEALGTIDQSAVSKAAIDYAYAHGTLVVASMADENSRHHNMPGVANHTLPVHAIATDAQNFDDNSGGVTTDATTFIAFNTCSNYGGENMLSVPGESCSSNATGAGAGAAGLVFSEALNQGITLSAEEAMQLFKMNADDIYVPQSSGGISTGFFESLPYFSQRFGYGRPNLANTLAAIDSKMIPPEVDLTSPAWFQILYSNQGPTTVPLMGSVAASRAQSYDYIVEWAPGVEPDDTLFVPLVNWVKNVPSGTVTGGATTPLAMLNPGQMNTAHTPDPDSVKFHENDRTVTIRVRAVAHYANGDVNGQARRSIAIVNSLPAGDAGTHNGLDPDIAPGFPIAMGASVESSPKLADIDGDGTRDIVVAATDGSLHVYSMKGGTPAELPGFPYHTQIIDGLNPSTSNGTTVPSYLAAPAYSKGSNGGIDPGIAREAIVATPAVGDIDGDGKPEIVVSTWPGTIYVINSSGQDVTGWPKRLSLIPSCPQPQTPKVNANPPCMDTGHYWSRGAGASPVLIDFDNDGKLEIVQAAFDGNIYVWHGDGTAQSGWPVLVHSTKSNEYNRILATPAVADFNGDGIPDVVTGTNEEVGAGGDDTSAFLIDGRGTNTPGGNPYFKDWPIVMESLHLFPVVGEGLDSSPVIGDVTKSGHPEILLQGNGAPPYLFPADPGAQSGLNDPANRLPVYDRDSGTQIGFDPSSIFGAGTAAFEPDTMFPLFSHPSLGDLDEDGVPDIIMAGGSLSLAGALGGNMSGRPFQQLLAMWSGATGHMMWGSPVPIEDYTFLVNETVADITGDGYPEVLLGTGGYFVRATDACGCEAPNWPKFTDAWLIATPAVGDIDGDHTLEVVTGSRDGYLFAWHTPGKDTGVVQWESFHHDNGNTGNYGAVLDQGVLKTTTQPLVCSATCGAAATSTSTSAGASGGCTCRAISTRDEQTGGLALVFAVGLGGTLVRRRRR